MEVNPKREVVEVVEVGGGWGRLGHHPRKYHVSPQALEQLRAHAGHTVEPRQRAERTMLLAPRDDPLREGRADSWETRDLRHVGAMLDLSLQFRIPHCYRTSATATSPTT